MRKKFVVTLSLGSFVGVTIVGLTFSFRANSFYKATANKGSNYILNLVDQKISEQDAQYSGEISSIVYTTSNNPISFKCSNVINSNEVWQSILPGGYFYNPILNSSTHNKITGIESIYFSSNDNCELSLSYGYTLDNENIIYSYDKTLVSNTSYHLEDLSPSYIYIKNDTNSTINISSFSISYSCEEKTYPKQDLTILMIGNSFADDTLFYAETVANSYGINLHLYDAYIGGCTLNNHYSNLNNNSATYSMRNMINGSWNYVNNMTLSGIINSNTWDIITFQQASAEVGRSESYSNLENLVGAVRNLVGSKPKFYWHQTWAYDKDYHDYYDYFAYFNNNQLTMYNAIVSCYNSQVLPTGLFEKTIFAGTTVQNLRTSYMKDTFSRDGKHMSSVHGRYLLGLNFLSQVYDVDLERSPCSYLPPEVDPSFSKIAYESIKNSWKNPLNCTNSLYPTRELANYDLSSYTEIDGELVGCSYWNSTDSSNYNKRISNSSGISNYYTSTKRFTSSELPVGSLVVIGDSFGIRPEAWISNSVQSEDNRPSEIYPNVLEITSDFWNGYAYRAFNIFKAGKTELTGQYDQIFDGFHIYVPNSEMYGLTPKSYNESYNTDSNLFQNNGLNIDFYERVHLDPITGFYMCNEYYDLTNKYVDDTAKRFVCTRPFYKVNNDLKEGTVIIADSGYQWRSDCWGNYGSYSPRPNNVTSQFTLLDDSFWNNFRRRTFNISSTSSAYVNQNYVGLVNHVRIYEPLDSIPDTPVSGVTLSEHSFTIYEGQTHHLTSSPYPFYATNKNVTYSSNNPSIASVDSNGLVTANNEGNAVITVTTEDGGYTDICYVSVLGIVEHYPEGTFRADVSINGTSYPFILSIGYQTSGLMAGRVNKSYLNPTGIYIDESTYEIHITTDGSFSGYYFGEITGTFDYINNQITNITFNGEISYIIDNNGSITASPVSTTNNTFFADCDGSTNDLQSQFKRRYMSGSWQVDTSNADRIVSNSDIYVSGGASLSRKGWTGGAVALNLNSDFASPKQVSNIHFWVYNPSNSNIELRTWIYKGTGLPSGNNKEIDKSVAYANSWTYIAISFDLASVYNFQIADFTNSGVNLTFDNIYLF